MEETNNTQRRHYLHIITTPGGLLDSNRPSACHGLVQEVLDSGAERTGKGKVAKMQGYLLINEGNTVKGKTKLGKLRAEDKYKEQNTQRLDTLDTKLATRRKG